MSDHDGGDASASVRLPLDLSLVSAHLNRKFITATQFSAGQSNPTYLLEDDAQNKVVLRRQPPGDLLPTAHDIVREHRVLSALANSSVPVPRILHLCKDKVVLGVDWYVMTFVNGCAPSDERLPGFSATQRATAWHSAIKTLAALHSVDHVAIGLQNHGKPGGGYVKRQLNAWSRAFGMVEAWLQEQHEEQSEGEPSDGNTVFDDDGRERLTRVLDAGDGMAKLEAGLRALLTTHAGSEPADEPTCIVHGDYRLGNLLLDVATGEVKAVLDWELSTLGHPLCDLAYFLSAHTAPAELGGFAGRPLPPGTPSEAEARKLYVELRGGALKLSDAQFAFFCAHAWHRRAAILHGVFARALQGNASAPDALKVGANGFCECVRLGSEALARAGGSRSRL